MTRYFPLLAVGLLAMALLACRQPIDEIDNTGTLTIANQSFAELTSVVWNNNQFGDSITPGTNATNAVEPGAGFIFFRRRTNHLIGRTSDIIVVESNQHVEFVFIDNTIVVEVHTNNGGMLSAVQGTVVWWDDAEGAMQPYRERRNFAGYYTCRRDLISNSQNRIHVHPPKSGRSLAVGGTNTAMLHLRVNLSRRARLSFWYANFAFSNNTAGATLSINNIERHRVTHDVLWSFIAFDLEAGVTDIRWEKRDGASADGHHFYLSLDDILIYYTE